MGTCHVYMIMAEKSRAVKIGSSRYSQDQRLAAIQACNHEKLSVIRSFPGDSLLEAKFHFHFWPRHIHLEWFHFADEMMTISPEQVVEATAGIPITPAWLRNKYGGWLAAEQEYKSWFAAAA